ncbi:MAG: hypothetical protein ACK5QC_03155 [Bacteroidota bacterium]
MEKIIYKYSLLQNLIIPASKLEDHPLGAVLFNNTMLEISNVFKRDVIWSGPERREAESFHEYRMNFIDQNKLNYAKDDINLPLIYGWFLTSVDNVFRNSCRIELTKWGTRNISAYVKVLDHLWSTNDPQMKEDLASVMLGIASSTITKIDEYKLLCEWVLENVFDKISINKNVIVRHSCRCVVERAYMLGIIQEDVILKCRPPYKVDFEYTKLDMNAIGSNRDGIYPIVHDLAWYVIEKSYKGFLDYTVTNKSKGNDFLENYSKKYGEKLGPNQFAMAYASSFINDLGLDRPDNERNGSTEATHGSKSRYATFEEKYTWCAVHELLGYLADNLPFSDYNEPKMIDNYAELVFVPNPSQEIENEFYNLQSPKSAWFYDNELFPTLSYTKDNFKEKIDNWIYNEIKINPIDWLTPSIESINRSVQTDKPNWLVLNSHVSRTEPEENGYWAIDINSFLTEEKLFKQIIENPINYFENLDHLKFRPISDTYLAPKDAVWMDWIEEDEGVDEVYLDDDEIYEIESTITSLHYNSVQSGEMEYIFPSKKIRKLTLIKEGNGDIFFNENQQVVAFCNKTTNESNNREETVFIDRDLLIEKLDNNGMKIFWIFKLFRRNAMSDKYEKLNYYKQNIENWIIWYQEGEFKIKFISRDN